MSKRKILMLAMTLCMVAILAIGGTLAYFTDGEEAENVFTMGKVDITLDETFIQNSLLMPGVDVNKDVVISVAADSQPAWVWYEWLIPAVLDSTDGSTGTNNILHVNSNGRTWDKYRENSAYWAEGQTAALPLEQTWDHDPNVELPNLLGPEGYIGQETIDGVVYNKYVVLYHGIVEAGKSTTEAMTKVYLDTKVDYDTKNNTYTIDGKPFAAPETVKILVRAYAIQAASLETVYDAYAAYNAQ